MRKQLAAVTAVAVLLSSVSPVFAGGSGECYERVHTPASYETVREKVLVRPAQRHVEVIPAIYGTEKRRVVVSPERVGYRDIPAQYRTVREKVLIEPERSVARVIPAVVRTVARTVKVSDGGYGWEWRVIKGKRVLCKVRNQPIYKTFHENVVVHPERVVHERIPGRWGYETRHVKVSGGHQERYVIPAEYSYVQERVLIQPAQKRVHHSPAEYAWTERTIKVSSGSSHWQRVRSYCK